MPTVVFRCDSSSIIGTGHVFRCLTLSRALRSFGFSSAFISRCNTPALSKLINETSIEYLLPPSTSEGQELDFISSLKPTAVILDHYCIGLEWQRTISASCNLIIIDDLANRPLACHWVINSNYGVTSKDYENWTGPATNLILGPKNSIIKQEVLDLRISARKSSDVIFCFFGGTDPTGENAKLLAALNTIDSVNNKITLFIGNSVRANLIGQNISRRHDVELVNDPKIFHKRLAEAKIFLGAGGTVTSERMYLGVPGFVVSVAPNQTEIARKLAHDNLQGYFGTAGEIDYVSCLRSMESTPDSKLEEWRILGMDAVAPLAETLLKEMIYGD